jgi:hypothetical protein
LIFGWMYVRFVVFFFFFFLGVVFSGLGHALATFWGFL